jgi:opacity protein-like surface antigen
MNFNGWNASAQGNINRWLGIDADFSGHYATPITVSSQIQSALNSAGIIGTLPKARSYSFLFGPVLSSRREGFTFFGHALFGVNDVSATLQSASVSGFSIPGLTESDTALAMAFGGGFDATLHKNLALRIIQADYLVTKHDFSEGVQGIATHQNNLRISTGVVYRFDGKAATPTKNDPS